MMLPEQCSFPEIEKELLAFWDEIDVYKNSLKYAKGRPEFTFYDGPPFATGLPHYGHILAGYTKDTVIRWAMQTGFYAERRFGWDCHGLPIEYEVDNALGIKSPSEIENMGIAKYNQECRNIAMKYAKEWEHLVKRLGRWIEFENDYKTLYPWYMESVWWVFKQLYVKGLVYRGVKVMPYSTACATPLSNFEANQNYKEVCDPSITVCFPLLEDPNVCLLAWTTTPWTLPSNLALCVHPDKTYVKVKDNNTEKCYIMIESKVSEVLKNDNKFTVIDKACNRVLVDLPLSSVVLLDGRLTRIWLHCFSFAKVVQMHATSPLQLDRLLDGILTCTCATLFDILQNAPNAFRVVCDNYVTEEAGTGVVQQAPYFGEDDYRVCTAYGIIEKTGQIVCPVDASGRFEASVRHFEGMYVKNADKKIIKYLKDSNRLFNESTILHSYPFCWRSDTPLIYKAVPCWFIKVENMIQQLMESNSSTHWVPSFVKDKRFSNWLKEARDWCFSRNRFWGNPIPLWVSDDMEEVVCVGSVEELKMLANITDEIEDLHRENIDKITIPSKRPGFPSLKRTPEVFDCWFESGSMPYAQLHYPFENAAKFESNFPADFIAEGIDQTRGWFYTLLVLSTALFNKPPARNVVVTGLILAADGSKMSKRKRNYPSPDVVLNKYGSDALRLYLISSPAVKAEALRFKEESVKDILKDVFIPWYNSLRFLMQNIERLKLDANIAFNFVENSNVKSSNIMDKWILSCLHSLGRFVLIEMSDYKLYNVVPKLIKFIDTLTNWYIRMNRNRLRGEVDLENCIDAVNTLTEVLYYMTHLMAPFAPFLSEYFYQQLKKLTMEFDEERNKSIHYRLIPNPRSDLIDTKIEDSVAVMRTVIELGRTIRERKILPLKFPLSEVIVVSDIQDKLDYVEELTFYIKKELNVRNLTTTSDRSKYGITLKAEPEHKVLGVKARQEYKTLVPAVKNLSASSIDELFRNGELIVNGFRLLPEDIRRTFSIANADRYAADSSGDIIVLLNITLDESLENEGKAREVINRIQKLRKEAKVVPTDPIKVYCCVKPIHSMLCGIVESFSEYITANIRKPVFINLKPEGNILIEREFELIDAKLVITIVTLEDSGKFAKDLRNGIINDIECLEKTSPVCRYINVIFLNDSMVSQQIGNFGSVFLENPVNEAILNYDCFMEEVCALFGLNKDAASLYFDAERKHLVPSDADVVIFCGQNFFVSYPSKPVTVSFENIIKKYPICPFINVHLMRRDNKDVKISGCMFKENPCGKSVLTYETLCIQASKIFHLNRDSIVFYSDYQCSCKITDLTDLMSYDELYVVEGV